jgi:hypothetical protein
MWWPRIHEVRLGGEVTARIDVMITAGNHLGVAMITIEQAIDAAHGSSSTGHAQRATLAEVTLRIGDDQGTCHALNSLVGSA